MTLAVTPASGSITHAKTVVRVNVSGADTNDDSSYTTNNAEDPKPYPIADEMRYYLTFEKGGAVLGKSYVFNVSADGDHTFNNYIFETAGSWTVRLNDASDDSSVETLSVTVA